MVVDSDIRFAALISITLTIIAIILACIGVGTSSWQTTYSDAPNNTAPSVSTSLYSTCYLTNSTCTNYLYMSESYLHLRQAYALAIVGILFLLFGALGTLNLALRATTRYSAVTDIRYRDFYNAVGPLCLCIAAITMLAAIAEGSRSILYNGYSANLYQTAHVISFFALCLSAYASGRQTVVHYDPTVIS